MPCVVQDIFVKIWPSLELREGRQIFSPSFSIRSLVSQKSLKLNLLWEGGNFGPSPFFNISNIPILEKPLLYVTDRFKSTWVYFYRIFFRKSNKHICDPSVHNESHVGKTQYGTNG